MCSVFENTLHADEGKGFDPECEIDFNTQSVPKTLLEHHEDSTKANLLSGDLLKRFTLAHINKQKDNSESFATYWKDQVRVHESLTSA